jgi:hypothetical protein
MVPTAQIGYMYPDKFINFLNPGWLGEENVETNLCRLPDGTTNM